MKRIQLLLVDDESDFLTAYVRRLARRNVDVYTACDGRDALEAIQNMKFDAVVMDVMMPGMNGIETLRRIKEVDPDLPVLLLSGHADSGALIKGMECGAFDYLLKPLATDELYSKVLDAVRARGFNAA